MRTPPLLMRLLPVPLLALPLAAITLTAQAPAPQGSLAPASAFANPPAIDTGASALWQDLQKLNTRASLMMIVAHPDDEDGGMLAYESRGQGVDTSLLTLNRGEGGQNEMSADYWDQLGLVRTQELLAAGQFYGVHQYFTRVADFGFSKTIQEALKEWGHDRVLYDCVRQVRITRPLVVASVFAGNVSDGHGQHQVSGLMSQEVYKLAGDPNVFPDQIRAGLRPWSPLKVYARVPFARVTEKGIYDYATGHWEPVRFNNYVTGTAIEGIPSKTLEIPEGNYQPLFGRSYLAVAREGLGKQKSQNGGVGEPQRGPFASPYHLYAERIGGKDSPLPEHESSFFEGIDISLAGIAGYAPDAQRSAWRTQLAALQASVTAAQQAFDPTHPEKAAPALATGLRQTEAMLQALQGSQLPAEAAFNMRHELELKRAQFNHALVAALGLSVQATMVNAGGPARGNLMPDLSFGQPTAQTVIAGQSLNVAIHLANQGATPVEVVEAGLVAPAGGSWNFTAKSPDAGSSAGPLAGEATRDLVFSTSVPADAPVTKPYFSRPELEQPFYDINEPRYLGLPDMPYPLAAQVRFRYNGVELQTAAVVQTIKRVVGPGPTPEPLLLAPAISVTVSPEAGILPLNSTALPLAVTVHSSVNGPAQGEVRLDLPEGWTAEPQVASFATAKQGEDRVVKFTITPHGIQSRPYTISALAIYNGTTYKQGFQTVGYEGLRPYPYYRPSVYRTTGTDVNVAPGLRVGYIMGTGDDVPRSLEDLGVHVNFLSAQDVATADLSGYDAIVLGIRAYAARPELATRNQRLLDYAAHGGVLIVQYQTPEFDHNYGPYPLSLTGDPEKVVEEDSGVQLLLPKDPVMNWPNHINAADFQGWVEERGHGFLHSWDAHYIAPTEMHDAGQDPQRGGLVYTRYGKGAYVYLAFAFFREMPEGVPGSFRIMANLISLDRNPGLHAGDAAQPASPAPH